MQQRREEREIDSVTFHIPLLGVRQQRRLLFKLASVAGTPLSQMAAEEVREIESGEGVDKDKAKALWQGLSTAFKSLQDESALRTYEEIIALFLAEGVEGTKVTYLHEKGELATAFLRDVYDKIFDQKLDLEFRWVMACLEVNFSGFLERLTGGLGSVLGDLLQKDSSKSSFQTESTG